LRQFFFGVLGWTPATVRREASLSDLAEAWKGHAAHHNIRLESPVSRRFLDEMLKKFG
jgi:hypothetical protein